MAVVSANVLKSYFESGDTPTCAQFVDLIDSTIMGDLISNIVSAASAGSTGLLQIDSATAVSFVTAPTTATTAAAGLIEIATTAEASAGTDTSRAMTPATHAAVGGGTVERIGLTDVTTSAATVEFTWAADAYDRVDVLIVDCDPETDAVEMRMRFSIDGSTFRTTADYEYHGRWDDGAVTRTDLANDNSYLLSDDAVNNDLDTAAGYTAQIIVYANASAATNRPLTMGNALVGYRNDGTNISVGHIYLDANVISTADLRGLQFFMSSGSIDTGRFTAWGFKNA